MIPAGKRSSYFTIWIEGGSTADAAGQITATYTKLGYAWGRITSAQAGPQSAALKSSKETYIGSRVVADALYVVTIPYQSGIGSKDRLTEVDRNGDTVTYEITGPPISDGGELSFPVAEVV